MGLISALILGYLIGSIPFGLMISKYWLGVDIREHGSGNIGMTNVLRVGGKLPGLLTFLLDFSKGSAALLIAVNLFELSPVPETLKIQLGGVSASVICGHVFSIFLRFNGGKGISTTLGALLVLDYWIALISVSIWISVFLAKRISSLAAIVMLSSLPFLFLVIPWLRAEDINYVQFAIFLMLSLLLIYRHRENIRRLYHGAEQQLKAKNPNEE
ncbi:glycerol-3-phosphate 1-O-acyltransferase PlsY [Deltaproteobacteria bacterium TL4]